MTVMDLISIARAGGSISLSANSCTTLDLISIARALTPNGKLHLKNASLKSSMDLISIARCKPGQVLFEF